MAIIKRVEIADLKVVRNIDYQNFASEAFPFSFFRLSFELYPDTFLAATTANEVAGYCIGAPTTTDTKRWWIISIAVSPGYQRQGYGSKLLLQMLQTLRRKDCSEIKLSVDPQNSAAKTLFQKYGFVQIKVESEYFGPGTVREIMHLVF